jgi:hypothetical protein
MSDHAAIVLTIAATVPSRSWIDAAATKRALGYEPSLDARLPR